MADIGRQTSKRVTVRLSDAEKEKLARIAKKLGVNGVRPTAAMALRCLIAKEKLS